MNISSTWSFEASFLVFLAIILFSQSLSTFLKSYIPMPLVMGVVFIAGFATGVLPPDIIPRSNMMAVGFIAFNVLVVHCGAMINIGFLRKNSRQTLICLVSMALCAAASFPILYPIIGRDLTLLSLGSTIGGGAPCAIASKWVLDKNPSIAVFPWMVFMFQGLFAMPPLVWAMKKETALVVQRTRDGLIVPAPSRPWPPRGLCSKIPGRYKNTAYYLFCVMAVQMVNIWLSKTVLAPLHININITALVFGFLLAAAGVMDAAPLFRSDSYGFLILGLMGLMANTLARNPLPNILRLLPAVLVSMALTTVLMVVLGLALGKKAGIGKYRGMILTLNCLNGYPVNEMLVEDVSKGCQTDAEKAAVRQELTPLLNMGTVLVSNGLSIFLVSVMVNLI